MATTPPWKRKNPNRTPTKLTEASKQLARARARRAGRTYPNLVDNMYAAKRQAAAGQKTAAKKPRAATTGAAKRRAVKKTAATKPPR